MHHRDASANRREAARLTERTAKAAARLRPGTRCTVSLGEGAYLTTDVADHPYLERGCWWVRVAGITEAQPCTRVRPVSPTPTKP